DEPVAPTKLNPKVPRDLETICLKCLRKEPARRYAAALDLAEDLRRFQAGEPIQARPVGTVERGGKWIRRHRAVAAMGAAIAAVMVVAFLLVTQAYHEALQQKEDADVERAKAIANEKLAEGERQKALKLKGIAEEETRLKSAALVQNHVSDG